MMRCPSVLRAAIDNRRAERQNFYFATATDAPTPAIVATAKSAQESSSYVDLWIGAKVVFGEGAVRPETFKVVGPVLKTGASLLILKRDCLLAGLPKQVR